MSYILDALRRAEAEREQGAVPGVHSQATAQAFSPVGRRWSGVSNSLKWALVATTAAAAVMALLAWRQGDPTPRDGSIAASTPALPSEAQPFVAVAPVVAANTAAGQVDSASSPLLPAAASTQQQRTPAAPPAPPLPLAHLPVIKQRAVGPNEAAANTPVPAPERIYSLEELPASLRSGLPPLQVGGASYSENPASRMLILNGQIYHEKDDIGPQHVLEQIRLKSAVLRYKNTRYSIVY